MNNINILDCTLRDGGYCNGWKFGFDNTKKIINGLLEANVDIIECGFITNKVEYSQNATRFNTIDEISKIIPKNRERKIYVAMMNYGEFNVDDLPENDGKSIDGIRVAFHKKNRVAALEVCERIKKKGYLVFIQAMVSLNYSDEEFLEIIHRVNEFKPYAFYIVDSFGMMKGKDLIRLYYMVEHNLERDVWIGFHSHNNMQLAYSNAIQLTCLQSNRNLIIDTSVYGMGRGAGNLNTEIFVEYLNDNVGGDYKLKPLLVLIDEILNDFYQRNPWGYSLPNYISAVHNAHPNYAGYLDDKKTLTIEDMNEIFCMMDDERKVSYDQSYIEELYLKYMVAGKAQEEHKNELQQKLTGKSIILVAPGKSSVDEFDNIKKSMRSDGTIIISINHEYSLLDTDYIFISNLRRFRELDKKNRSKCIVTSNIADDGVYYRTNYRDLINDVEAVSDNAGLMAIKFFSFFDIKMIQLVGFDGYSHDVKENYGISDLEILTRNAVLDAINIGMNKVLKKYSKEVHLSFLTKPKNLNI